MKVFNTNAAAAAKIIGAVRAEETIIAVQEDLHRSGWLAADNWRIWEADNGAYALSGGRGNIIVAGYDDRPMFKTQEAFTAWANQAPELTAQVRYAAVAEDLPAAWEAIGHWCPNRMVDTLWEYMGCDLLPYLNEWHYLLRGYGDTILLLWFGAPLNTADVSALEALAFGEPASGQVELSIFEGANSLAARNLNYDAYELMEDSNEYGVWDPTYAAAALRELVRRDAGAAVSEAVYQWALDNFAEYLPYRG